MTYISRTWKVWRPISRQLGSTWKVWRPISRQLGSTWKVWRPIKTIGQYLEGLAPQTREFPLKFGCKMTHQKFQVPFLPAPGLHFNQVPFRGRPSLDDGK